MLFWLYLREERYEEEVKSSDAVVSSLFVIVSKLLAVKIGRWRQRGFLSEDRVFEDNFCVGFYVVLVLEIKAGLTSTSRRGKYHHHTCMYHMKEWKQMQVIRHNENKIYSNGGYLKQ
jgi:hypothetical protein